MGSRSLLNKSPEIIPSLRLWLRQTLPPQAFALVQYYYWYLMIYFPRLVASPFVKREPTVRGFGGGDGALKLATQLRSVDVVRPTKLCRIMTRHGSDKGRSRHNYTTVYTTLFETYRDRPLRIFELGLGTNNPGLASSMGVVGLPGASLRGWREYFPRALVYGADIDTSILFQEDRIKTFYCNQLDQAIIRELWSRPELQSGVDIIIEDGLHTFEANVSFLEGSLDRLAPGGTYVVEDIDSSCVDAWCDQIERVYSRKYPTYQFALVILPVSQRFKNTVNNLLVIRRGTE